MHNTRAAKTAMKAAAFPSRQCLSRAIAVATGIVEVVVDMATVVVVVKAADNNNNFELLVSCCSSADISYLGGRR
jgi:hypothetical protein